MKKHRHHAIRTQQNVTEFEEAFIDPERYHEMIGLEGVPDLTKFPDGIYVFGTKNFDKILGYFAESQINKLTGKEMLGN